MWQPQSLTTLWASTVCYRYSFFLFYLVCEATGTAATHGILCQPRVILKMIVEKQMECRLAGETEVLGENLPQRYFCPSQNPTWPNPGRHSWKPVTNRLSYGAAYRDSLALSFSFLLWTTKRSGQIQSSGMWCQAVMLIIDSISENMLTASSILKMEPAGSSTKLLTIYWLHGGITQRTVSLIVTAMKTSNPSAWTSVRNASKNLTEVLM
jgi:hypothetical protein